MEPGSIFRYQIQELGLEQLSSCPQGQSERRVEEEAASPAVLGRAGERRPVSDLDCSESPRCLTLLAYLGTPGLKKCSMLPCPF